MLQQRKNNWSGWYVSFLRERQERGKRVRAGRVTEILEVSAAQKMKLKIKPLSVNIAWRSGPRYRTRAYLDYERDLLQLLPRKVKIPKKIEIRFLFGVSNSNSDVDNFIKPLLDILAKAYGFNDNQVWKLTAEKRKVKKGEEFMEVYFVPSEL